MINFKLKAKDFDRIVNIGGNKKLADFQETLLKRMNISIHVPEMNPLFQVVLSEIDAEDIEFTYEICPDIPDRVLFHIYADGERWVVGDFKENRVAALQIIPDSADPRLLHFMTNVTAYVWNGIQYSMTHMNEGWIYMEVKEVNTNA